MNNTTRSAVAAAGLAIMAAFNTVAAETNTLPYPLYGQTMEERETLEWLWPKAQRFSGIKSVHGDSYGHLPIYKVTKEEMTKEVCPTDPQNCRNLGAAYETEKKYILLRGDLSPESDIMSASFLLHEFTHALQNETRTDEQMYGTCARLKQTELEAYDAQNAFLKDEGAFFRAGIGMHMMVCKDENGTSTPMAAANPSR